MAEFDFRKGYQPGRRSDARTFQIALALVALGDAVRLTVLGGFVFPAWLAVLLLLAFALANRLRDAGRPILMLALPIGVAIAAKAVVALIALFATAYPDFVMFLEARGVDLNDPMAVQSLADDTAIRSAYQERLQSSPELLNELVSAGDWPSTWAFWAVIAVFAWAWSGRRVFE